MPSRSRVVPWFDLNGECMENKESRSPWRVLRERKLVLIVTVIVVLVVTGALTFLRTPLYRAQTTMVREQTSIDQALFGTTVFPYEDVQRDLVTTAQSVTSEIVATGVKQQLGSSLSVGQLLSMVSANPSSDSNTVTVSATSPYPQQAAAVANAFATETILLRQQSDRNAIVSARKVLESQLASMTTTQLASAEGLDLASRVNELKLLEQMQTGGYVVWQQAQTPLTQISPRPVRDMGIGLALGVILALVFAFVLDRIDRRVKEESAFEAVLGIPVLASVPRLGRRWIKRDHNNAAGFVGFRDPRSPLIEPYRTLRSNLQYFEVEKGLSTILITSGLPREGKTATTANLAMSLALSGARVIVVDADLRNPMMHNYLELKNDIGLSTVLAGGSQVADALKVVKLDKYLPPNGTIGKRSAVDQSSLQRDFLCMTSGPLPPNPAELLASVKMQEFLTNVVGLADYVLIDSAPVLLVADALGIASRVDGVVVVTRLNSTTFDEAREMRTLMERVGARVIGVVVGGTRANQGHRYSYGYYSEEQLGN